MNRTLSGRRFTQLLDHVDLANDEGQRKALDLQAALEEKPLISFITKSGWLFLLTELLLSLLAKKFFLDNTSEHLTAQRGLLTKDTRRLFVHFLALNLSLGIFLGLIADCLTGKKFIVMCVLSFDIAFYFVIVMTELWPLVDPSISWEVTVYFDTVLYASQGVYIAAMYESLASEDYSLLLLYSCLKLVCSCVGRLLFVLVHVFTQTMVHKRTVLNFGCFITLIVILFVWMLFIRKSKKSNRIELLTILKHMAHVMIRKARFRQRVEDDHKNGRRLSLKETRMQFEISRKLLQFFLFMIPLITTSFVTQSGIHIFRRIFYRLENVEWRQTNAFEITQCLSILVSIPLIEVLFIPILGKIFKRQTTFVFRLLASLIFGLITYLYGIYIMKVVTIDAPGIPSSWTSEIRFINGLNDAVSLRPIDNEFGRAVITPQSAKLLTYIRPYAGMPTKSVLQIELETNFKYVMGISVEQESSVTYFITDFMEIRRVPGSDPIFGGPPGTNDPVKSRLYFANLNSELLMKLVLTFHHSIRPRDSDAENIKFVSVPAGKKVVFQISSGTYVVTIEHTDIVKIYTFGPGGVYGIIYLPEVKESTSKYNVFEIIPPTSLSPFYGILFDLMAWFSYGFVIVILDVFVFLKSPQELRAFTFSVYKFFETAFFAEIQNIVLTVRNHRSIGLYTLILYGSVYVVLCVISGFIILKNRQYFRIKSNYDAR